MTQHLHLYLLSSHFPQVGLFTVVVVLLAQSLDRAVTCLEDGAEEDIHSICRNSHELGLAEPQDLCNIRAINTE
jgi:hypothetical protein